MARSLISFGGNEPGMQKQTISQAGSSRPDRSCRVSPMLLRMSLGSNSSKGSLENTTGDTTYTYRCRHPFPTIERGPRSVFLKFLLVIVLVRRLEILLSRRRGGRRPGWCGQAMLTTDLVSNLQPTRGMKRRRECRLIVELGGAVHGGPLEIERDETRTTYLKELGICAMRFENRAIFKSLELVLNSIRIALQAGKGTGIA